MMLPLLHHGMLLVGLPFTEAALHHTRDGGGPYGAGTTAQEGRPPSDDEKRLAYALGARVAGIAARLAATP
jgi:NAD(P)H dehydrogenase (quinone)